MTNIGENMGTVRKVTSQVWSRVSRFDTPLDYSDLEQEACHAYIKAEAEWDSKLGTKMNTYITQAIKNRLNFVADEFIQQSVYEKNDFTSEEGIFDLVNNHACESEEIDHDLDFEFVSSTLSPVAKVIFKETFAPSEKMISVFQTKEKEAFKAGKRRSGYFYMNCVGNFLIENGLSKMIVTNAKKEIIELGKGRIC